MNLSVLSADVSPSLAALVPVALLVVVTLIAAVIVGSRRTARKRLTVDRHDRPATGARNGQQRGRTWQTIDDDPDQGIPHRYPVAEPDDLPAARAPLPTPAATGSMHEY